MTTTGHDAGDDLLRILDELDTLIASARAMPMSASAIVNREEVLDLIERARAAVPTAVHRAEDIVADAGAVLAQGRQESERIIRHAQEEADRLVAGETVVRLANERADTIVAAAEEHAATLRRGADDYCDRTLAALEIELGRVTDQLRAGREVLAGRLSESEPARHRPRPADPAGDGLPHRRHGWSVDPSAAPSRH